MKKHLVFLKILALFLCFSNSSFSQKKLLPNTIDSFTKKVFSKSVKIKKTKIGTYCGGKTYFIEGSDSKGKLNKRTIVFEKNNEFSQSNKFIYWCSTRALVAYYSMIEGIETKEDLKNLLIKFEGDGKILVTNKIIQENKEPEKEMSGSQYVSFQEFTDETGCQN